MMGVGVHLKSWKSSVIIKVLSLYFFIDELLQITMLLSFIEKSFYSPYTRMLNNYERVRLTSSCPAVKTMKIRGIKNLTLWHL